MAALIIPSIFTAVDKVSATARKMTSNISRFGKRAEASLARAERGFRRLISPLSKVNKMLGGFGLFLTGAAIVAVIGGAVSIFIDFEQAGANLSAVLGKTRAQTVLLTEDAKRLGATTAFTASQVTGLQTEFAKLGFSQKEILNATSATLSLAAATSTELPQAAKQVGAAIRAFGLDASESARVADVFALSTSKSALDMEFLAVSMSKVAPIASKFGFSIEDSVGLLGSLADAGFDASTAATSTKNIILNLADSNGKLAKALGRPIKSLPDLIGGFKELRAKGIDLNKMLQLTDKRSVAAFATFLENAEKVDALSDALKNAKGAAEAMAKTQLDTLGGSITILKSAWEGFILSMEDGTGAFSNTLRIIVRVATGMLSLASGTAKAEDQLEGIEKPIRVLANRGIFWLKVIGATVAGLIAMKIILIASRAIIAGYNIVVGISAAVQGKWNVALARGGLTLKAYKVAVGIATAAQFLWNVATSGFKILLQVAGIIASTIAATVYTVAIGAATAAQSLFNAVIAANPGALVIAGIILAIGFVISLVQSFVRNWEMIKNAFKTDGIVGALKAIGKTIFDAILMPLQKMFELLANVPGIGGFSQNIVEKIAGFREQLGVNVTTDESGKEIINPAATVEQSRTERFETTEKQQASIIIKDQTGRAELDTGGGLIPITLENTFTTD